MTRAATPMTSVRMRLLAGGWVQVCRENAELLRLEGEEVEVKEFCRKWKPMDGQYEYTVRMQFRARLKENVMAKKPFIEFDGKTLPAFGSSAVVEVEYRSGRRAQGTEPWMFAGWNHTGTSTDIVKYRVL